MANERFDDVWDAVGETQVEASLLKAKAELMRAIESKIRGEGWTQAEAARRLNVRQPRVSDLVRGKISLFSLDNLYTMADAIGLHPEVRLATAA